MNIAPFLTSSLDGLDLFLRPPQIHSSWRDAINCITIKHTDWLFPSDKLSALGARHYIFQLSPSDIAGISRRIPADLDSYEFDCSELDDFTSALRWADALLLTRLTKLTISVRSEVDLDLRFLPSLRQLWIACGIENVWKSLQCCPLEHLEMATGMRGVTQLQHPISAKDVHVRTLRDSRETLVVARSFPDTVRLSAQYLHVIDLDCAIKLRHLTICGAGYNLTSAHPINLSSLTIRSASGASLVLQGTISKEIRISHLNCEQLSIAFAVPTTTSGIWVPSFYDE